MRALKIAATGMDCNTTVLQTMLCFTAAISQGSHQPGFPIDCGGDGDVIQRVQWPVCTAQGIQSNGAVPIWKPICCHIQKTLVCGPSDLLQQPLLGILDRCRALGLFHVFDGTFTRQFLESLK